MSVLEYLPIQSRLTPREREALAGAAVKKAVPKGALLQEAGGSCLGLIIVRSGRLRAFMLSEEGKEVTLYRLLERDICLFSAACVMQSIQFDVTIEAETDCELYIIPPNVYKSLMDGSAILANYTNEVMATRFSDVMWLIEQVLWRSFDRRLAAFLLEESALSGGDLVKITHDRIAAHLGTAREVVTRMLKYFQDEGMVSLARGEIRLTDRGRLKALAL